MAGQTLKMSDQFYIDLVDNSTSQLLIIILHFVLYRCSFYSNMLFSINVACYCVGMYGGWDWLKGEQHDITLYICGEGKLLTRKCPV